MTTLLSELLDELDYLSVSVRLSRDTTGQGTALHSSLCDRLKQVKVAIRIQRAADPWRIQPVYVVARSRKEAMMLAKLTGWYTMAQAQKHLQVVRSSVSSNWVMAQSYRVFRTMLHHGQRRM